MQDALQSGALNPVNVYRVLVGTVVCAVFPNEIPSHQSITKSLVEVAEVIAALHICEQRFLIKPLKRLALPIDKSTGLKPSVNERTPDHDGPVAGVIGALIDRKSQRVQA